MIDSLKINKPVLVGHSIGGEELSSVGSRHPEKVAGLVYLDAGYSYAYYNRDRGDFNIDLAELQRKLEQLQIRNRPLDPRALAREIEETTLPQFEKSLKHWEANLPANPPAAPPGAPPPGSAPGVPISVPAIYAGWQKYTEIKVPILAIFALPHDFGQVPAANRAALEAADADSEVQAKAFESGLPSAHIVRLPHAQHYVFRSNEADVIREMNAFLTGLP